MVKGISRRVVVVDSPDQLSPAVYTLMGAAGIGLVWLTVWLI